jgi:NDP-sugar pyrophosphorylase family protein
MVGASQFFDDSEYKYPKPLIEINGKTIIELVINNLSSTRDANFIFVVNEDDCKKHHLDNVLSIVTDHNCHVVKISKQTKGAACSVLMAIDKIAGEKPLIIANSDQVLDVDFNSVIAKLDQADAGVITFNSIHPKWSFVKLNNDEVIETAEKKPLSKEAIAGFYYFSQGDFFIESAFSMIKKDASVDGLFYVSPVFNEMILKGKKVKRVNIDSKQYHSFYSPQKIKEYERLVSC